MTRALFAAVVCALFSACASLKPHYEPSPAPANKTDNVQREHAEEAAIAAAIQQTHITKEDYRLSGGDLLEITVLGLKDMDRSARVGQTGDISYPLVGEVKVGGLTLPQAQAALVLKLKDYLRDPQVTLFIKEYGNKKVFVFGQVNKPGAIELPAETKLTVLEAVSQAEGFTRIAASDRTRVIRLVNGKSQSFVIEVSAITKRGEKDKDMVLEPNDIVFVPESMF
jgi:polysaccharide export outer membrane protein